MGAKPARGSAKYRAALLMLDLLKDLWGFMRERRKLWLAPLVVALLVVGALVAVAQFSTVAPLIYTLF